MLGLAACGDDGGSGGGQASGGGEGGGTIRVALGDIESVETLALFIALDRVRAAGHQGRADRARRRGPRQPGRGRRPGRRRPRRAVRPDPGLGRSAADLLPAPAPALLPRRRQGRVPQLAGARRQDAGRALPRLDERGPRPHHRAGAEGIEFGKISFVPGAEVRATALLRGNVKAAMLDIPNKNYVMSEEPGRFHVLPTPETAASDEVLFANTEWLKQNGQSAQVLLEEILTVWRSMAKDPGFVQKERERLGLARDLPPELEKELVPYYRQGVEEGLFTQDCGGEAAARDDFEFYGAAGQLKGDPADLKVDGLLEPRAGRRRVEQGRASRAAEWPRRSRAAPAAWRPGGVAAPVAWRPGRASPGCCAARRSCSCSACGSGAAAAPVEHRVPHVHRDARRVRRHAGRRHVRPRLRRDRGAADRRRAAHRGRRRARRRRHGPVGAGRVAGAARLHRAAGVAVGGDRPADHVHLRDRVHRQGVRGGAAQRAGHRAQLLPRDRQHPAVAAGDEQRVPGHAPGSGSGR